MTRSRLALALAVALASPAFADSTDGGTGVTVVVAESGETTLTVTHGELAVKAAGEETRVKRGERVRAKRGDKARLVLLAPECSEPSDGARLQSLAVALKWKPVDGASRYKITVASDAELGTIVWSSARAEGGKAQIALKNPGTYYWRVVPVGARDSEGPASIVSHFTVDAPPPKLKAGKPSWQ